MRLEDRVVEIVNEYLWWDIEKELTEHGAAHVRAIVRQEPTSLLPSTEDALRLLILEAIRFFKGLAGKLFAELEGDLVNGRSQG